MDDVTDILAEQVSSSRRWSRKLPTCSGMRFRQFSMETGKELVIVFETIFLYNIHESHKYQSIQIKFRRMILCMKS